MRDPRISVLIIDDSALVRKLLTDVLNSDPEIEVVGTAPDPIIAARKIQNLSPDVLTLDIEMPRMDGLTFLERLMAQRPLPVVVISSLTQKGAEATFKALERGAVEVVAKPTSDIRQNLSEQSDLICRAVKAAAMARVKKRAAAVLAPQPKLSIDAVLPKMRPRRPTERTEKIVAIGTSTGGTEALGKILGALPEWCPPIAVVQHMPAHFTRVFAERLNRTCEMEVKEAVSGDTLVQGRVIIAPGDKHMVLVRNGKGYAVDVIDGPLVNRHRPSVGVLFRSAATVAGANAIGIILTGMGDDGARGLKEMREAGAHTIAQDEESCVVFGMPREAIKLEAACEVLPLSKVAPAILELTALAPYSSEEASGGHDLRRVV